MEESRARKHLGAFERYLTLGAFLCMVAGVAIGKLLPGFTDAIRRLELVDGTHQIRARFYWSKSIEVFVCPV